MTDSLLGGRSVLGLALLLLVAGWGGTASDVRAQEFGRIAEVETNASYFFYAQPGEATIQVSLWGGGQSGVYEVPDSTHLDRLLTLSGGVTGVQEREENQKPAKVTVRLYRGGQSEEDPFVEARLRDILEDKVDAPRLREGDRVVIETVRPTRFTWRDGLSLTTTLLSVTSLVLRIIRIGN